MSVVLSKSECLFLAFLCFFLLLCHEVFFLKKERNAGWLFFVINMTGLIFFLIQESTLLNSPTLSFVFLFISSLVLFLIGFYIFGGGFNVKVLSTLISSVRVYDIKRMRTLNRVGCFFYFLAFFYELSVASWVFPAFAENKLLAYYSFPQTFVHYLVVSSIPITIIYSYLRFVCKVKSKIDDLLLMTLMLFNILILARAVFMTQVFMVIYFWFVSRGVRLKIRYFLLGLVLLLVFITVAGYFRTGDTLRVLLDIGGLSKWAVWMTPFAWPYLYFSTSIENFRHVFENFDLEVVTYGLRTPMIYFFSLIQNKEAIPYWADAETSAGGFNTFGMYLTAYYDFDYGFPVYFFIFGAITAVLKNSKLTVFRMFWPYWVYCIFTSSVNDYIANFFTLVYITYLIAVVLFSRKFCFKKR